MMVLYKLNNFFLLLSFIVKNTLKIPNVLISEKIEIFVTLQDKMAFYLSLIVSALPLPLSSVLACIWSLYRIARSKSVFLKNYQTNPLQGKLRGWIAEFNPIFLCVVKVIDYALVNGRFGEFNLVCSWLNNKTSLAYTVHLKQEFSLSLLYALIVWQ